MIAPEAGSSGAGKSAGRGSVDGSNQGESSRLLQPAIKDRTKNETNQRQAEGTVDVQRRNSKDQRPEKKARLSEDVEVIEDVSDDGEERVRREAEMEAKREKSHTTKRVEVLEDEAYI